jgi:hypothetical protein
MTATAPHRLYACLHCWKLAQAESGAALSYLAPTCALGRGTKHEWQYASVIPRTTPPESPSPPLTLADVPAIAEAVRDLVVEAYQPPPDMNFAKVYGLLMEERKAVEPLRARLARALEVVEAARGLKAADFMTDPMQEGPDDFDLLQQALAALDEGERG